MAVSKIRGVLCDLDGTLYVGDRLIEGAAGTLAYLRRRGLSLRFLTNTTTSSRKSLFARVRSLGLDIGEEELLSAAYAGVLYLRAAGSPRCRLLLEKDAAEDYREFPADDVAPEVIVVGDIGARWDYELLNSLFRQLISGARLVGLHKNRYYRTQRGMMLDAGAFVEALEYASRSSAVIVGKPAPEFFGLAIESLAIPKESVIIIGDDIETDIGAAQAEGIAGILVKTGKFREDLTSRVAVIPHFSVDSIKSIPALFETFP
ncbi:MAG TPA: TIGR01458 family HAD-type hydrolase [Spirochaetia bacterium]|nr:TIGR01458 family HAD-type hydrolase [Spirochaetia bacterium]